MTPGPGANDLLAEDGDPDFIIRKSRRVQRGLFDFERNVLRGGFGPDHGRRAKLLSAAAQHDLADGVARDEVHFLVGAFGADGAFEFHGADAAGAGLIVDEVVDGAELAVGAGLHVACDGGAEGVTRDLDFTDAAFGGDRGVVDVGDFRFRQPALADFDGGAVGILFDFEQIELAGRDLGAAIQELSDELAERSGYFDRGV